MLYIVVVIYCLISRMYFAHIQLNRKLQHVGFVTYPPPPQKNEDIKKYKYGTVGVG